MKERIIEIHPSQEEFEDSDDPRDDDIEHDKVQSPWKIGIHQSSIVDEYKNN